MGRKAFEQFVCECGERCVMLKHVQSGKLAPITMEFYDGGNIDWEGDGYRIVPKAERERDPAPRRLNHFANCPVRRNFGGRS